MSNFRHEPVTQRLDTVPSQPTDPSYALMAHMIPYFPSYEGSLAVARGLIAAGVRYLELQFPYSDPSADGPDIQGAGAAALKAGFRVARGWDFIDTIRTLQGARDIPIFVMSYAGMVYARGVAAFVQEAAAHGVRGLIVPDLPFDSDEGLGHAARAAGVEVVPVVPITVLPTRLEEILSAAPHYLYVSLRVGITGAQTVIEPATLTFLERAKARGVRVLAGFGVSTHEQVRLLAPHVDAVVVGSALVRAVRAVHGGMGEQNATPERIENAILDAARRLIGSSDHSY